VPCSDLDIEVSECSFDELAHTLRRFGSTDVVGRSFGTIKLKRDGTPYDFSLPRRESKTGQGHRGFKIDPDPSLSFAEAAARRDFTVNAMAWDHTDQLLVDPFGGKTDLDQRILRHTSPAFVEDPLRVDSSSTWHRRPSSYAVQSPIHLLNSHWSASGVNGTNGLCLLKNRRRE
jgi:tRNA nucleotidyltransferase (CCA-adding enzyme)